MFSSSTHNVTRVGRGFSMKKGIALLIYVTTLLIFVLLVIVHRGTSTTIGRLIERSEWLVIGDRPLVVTNATKLIIFLHFHKAGGTSIVRAARRGQNLYIPNVNGNPHEPITKTSGNAHRIPFWTFSKQKLIEFLTYCRDHDTTFIATENEWFQSPSAFDEDFKFRYRLELVTQIRNPFDRFISNYFFIKDFNPFRQMQVPFVQRLEMYHSLERAHHFTDWNMYVRVLSSQFDRNVTEKDLETAKRELDKFDLVTVMEMPDVSDVWSAKYGFNMQHWNSNMKYEEQFAAERERDKDFDQKLLEFRKEFEILNRFDYMLYDYAKQLHQKFAINASSKENKGTS